MLLEEIRFPSQVCACPERRNGNRRQVNTAASRSQRTLDSLANALEQANQLMLAIDLFETVRTDL